jgi:diguanylate cyclase (GGDEF)-like protein
MFSEKFQNKDESFDKKDYETEIRLLKETIERLNRESLELRKENARLKEENEELKRKLEKIEEEIIHDNLTGLYTRKYFSERVENDIAKLLEETGERREEGYKNLSILFCDIDDFKKINDTYGHSFGDQILKRVSEILQENIRDTDIAARWGGEEIVIELLGADAKEATKKAHDLKELVKEKIQEEFQIPLSLSIGISELKSGDNFDEKIKNADEAMYQAKKEGKDKVISFDEIKKEEST